MSPGGGLGMSPGGGGGTSPAGSRRWVAPIAAAALLLAAAGGDGTRRVEAVGAVGLDAEKPLDRPPRDAALAEALGDAVRRVAVEFLPDVAPDDRDAVLGDLLGSDPFAYVSRFQVIEDRGERPALFVDDPDVETEYVVVVEADVDTARVRSRLEEAGLLLEATGVDRRPAIRVVVEGLDAYADYASLREVLLGPIGARSAQPLEMERGRVVLRVDADRDPEELLADLSATADAGSLRVVPLGAREDTLIVRVERVESGDVPPGPTGGDASGGAPVPAAAPRGSRIDTHDRNRY